ncbi:hypothetical protein BTM25_40680 [Actinomadura rubteroloni]|uniref:LppX_LprAFG lipoprotein n=1 Tax=Actinomadura rubteroloni TaxID=1926885 RepID=A0A2P4UK26_9ACTN|nr:hypothetical protein [Actinomadura rubteroloni]POM25424.1 hypothetical protein BTM25_40680 [Actinomadura rubteroloni]
MRFRRAAVGAAVTAGLVASLTGCLGSGSGQAGGKGGGKGGAAAADVRLTAAQLLGRSATRARQVDSYTMDGTFEGSIDGHKIKAGTSMKMRTAVRLRSPMAMRMSMEPSAVDGEQIPGVTMLLDAEALYVKMPLLSELNGGKPWTKMALAEMGASGSDVASLMNQAKVQGPGSQTKVFTGSKDVREVGTEVVGGVRTRHFTGTLSLTDALAAADPDVRESLNDFKKMKATSLSFDLWVGPDDLPRKLTNRISTPAGPLTTSALYSGYNAPVNITPPPASQVGTFKEGLAGLGA